MSFNATAAGGATRSPTVAFNPASGTFTLGGTIQMLSASLPPAFAVPFATTDSGYAASGLGCYQWSGGGPTAVQAHAPGNAPLNLGQIDVLAADAWHLIIIEGSVGSAAGKVWINHVDRTVNSLARLVGASPFGLCCLPGNTASNRWRGRVAEVFGVARALTAGERANLWNGGACAPPETAISGGLAFHFRGDAPFTTTILDASGNGLDLTVGGTLEYIADHPFSRAAAPTYRKRPEQVGGLHLLAGVY